MAMPWYEWENVRNRLFTFGRAMQGISPYRVLIEPDPKKCPTGYCNFTRRAFAVNPGIFDVPTRDQYQLTKALLVHEAGHRRFTKPWRLSPVVHEVANILEDERIERQMYEEFAGIRWLISEFPERLYAESKPVDERSDCPGELVSYFLQLRWAKRIGQPVKGSLSPKNDDLWEKIEPLVYEAWEAESTEIVTRNAARIVDILGIKEVDISAWVRELQGKLGTADGERGEGDEAETREAKGKPLSLLDVEESIEPTPFDGEVLPNDKREGNGRQAIEPEPYIELQERVRPLVQELVEELSWEQTPDKPEAAERGGRLSVRDYLRDKYRPFISEEDSRKAPLMLSLKVIVDHSTSLNYYSSGRKTRIESVAEAVMLLHLVCLELGIPHEVLVTPQDLKIADLDSCERGKALIAGLVPALCGFEDMGAAIKTHALPMARDPEDIKLVLCLTDGACNDAKLGKKICQSLHGKVDVIGVLMDPDKTTQEYVADMFGKDRIICCKSKELPQKLGNILRAIQGV